MLARYNEMLCVITVMIHFKHLRQQICGKITVLNFTPVYPLNRAQQVVVKSTFLLSFVICMETTRGHVTYHEPTRYMLLYFIREKSYFHAVSRTTGLKVVK